MSTASPLNNYLNSLPEFALPLRVQSLYSDLGKQKISNPSGYTANLSWWRNQLQEIVRRVIQPTSKDLLVLHVNQELSEDLRWGKPGKPLGLGAVMSDLVNEGTFFALQYFLNSPVPIYDGGSIVARVTSLLVTKPLWWALEQLNLVPPEGYTAESWDVSWKRVQGDYVLLSQVELVARKIIDKQRQGDSLSLSEQLHNEQSFGKYARECYESDPPLSDLDVKILIRYLTRDKQAMIMDGEVLKFVDPSSLISTEITSVDHGVLELKSTIARLEDQIDSIQRNIETRTNQIKAALAKSRKEVAKAYLLSKKALESLVAQRVGSLTNLQAALLSIDQAHGDASILRAYENSSKVLKEILARPEMKLEKVDAVMDSLKDGMENAEEIRRAIEIGGQEIRETSGVELSDDDLQKELLALEKEERQRLLQEEEERAKEAMRKLRESGVDVPVEEPSSWEKIEHHDAVPEAA